jgi:hypothetical protein
MEQKRNMDKIDKKGSAETKYVSTIQGGSEDYTFMRKRIMTRLS